LYTVLLAAGGRPSVLKTADGGKTWVPVADPGLGGIESKGYSMAVGSDGRLHLVMHDHGAGDHFYHMEFDGEKWLAKERVSLEDESGGRSPTVALDGEGNLHVLWQDGGSHAFYRMKKKGKWGEVEQVGNLGQQTTCAVDGRNRVHAAGGYGSGIKYRMRDGDGWGQLMTVDRDGNARHASLALDSGNTAHMAWTADGYGEGWRIYYSCRAGKGWTERRLISAPHENPANDQYHNPSLAVDGKDIVHVVFDGAEPGGKKYLYYVRKEKGVWSAQKKITSAENMVRHPQLRWSFWPECNRVKDGEDLDLFATEMKEPGFRVLYRKGNK